MSAGALLAAAAMKPRRRMPPPPAGEEALRDRRRRLARLPVPGRDPDDARRQRRAGRRLRHQRRAAGAGAHARAERGPRRAARLPRRRVRQDDRRDQAGRRHRDDRRRTHADYICRAMELGCDVITEKPMTTDAEKCQRILDTRAQDRAALPGGVQLPLHAGARPGEGAAHGRRSSATCCRSTFTGCSTPTTAPTTSGAGTARRSFRAA